MRKITYILSGDLHARKAAPKYRKDDYFETWKTKFKWIINLANKLNATPLFAGDIYDKYSVSIDVVNDILSLFAEFNNIPIVVAGQHDLRNHVDTYGTPLKTLQLANFVQWNCDNKYITGVDFGQKVPSNKRGILIIHKCITEKKPPFYLEDAISAKKFLKRHPTYKVVVSGDYHVPYVVKLKDRALINVGTIIRNKKDMHSYKPAVWILEMNETHTEILSIRKKIIPHKPFNDVFNIESIHRDEERGLSIDIQKMESLLKEGVEISSLNNAVWSIYEKIKNKININKELVKTILKRSKK